MLTVTSRKELKRIVEGNDTFAGRLFDIFIQGLIVVSLIGFTVDTLPNLSPPIYEALDLLEGVAVALFTVEYLLRLIVADRKIGFIFSFFGIIDLLAILPFYLPTDLALVPLRAFRLLRLFKLFRYSQAIRRYHRAFVIAKDELVLFSAAAGVVLYLSAVGIYFFESEAQPEVFASVLHSLWWAVVTLTTVGYGDVYPITLGGRLFTFVVLTMGLGIVAVPTGLVAAALSKAREEEEGE